MLMQIHDIGSVMKPHKVRAMALLHSQLLKRRTPVHTQGW
jgi:hypothetical protein